MKMNKVLKNLFLSGAVSLVTAFSSDAQEQTRALPQAMKNQTKGIEADSAHKPHALMVIQNLSAGDTGEFERVWKPMFKDLRDILSAEYHVDTIGNGFDGIEMMNNTKIDSVLTAMGENSPGYFIYAAGHGTVSGAGIHQLTWEEEKFNESAHQNEVKDRKLNSVDFFEKVLKYAVKYKKPLKYIFDACAGEEMIEDFYDVYKTMCKEKGVKSLGIDIQLETFSKRGEGHFSRTITKAIKNMQLHLEKTDLKNIYHATNNFIIDDVEASKAAQKKPTSGSALLHISKNGKATVLSVDQTIKDHKGKALTVEEKNLASENYYRFFYPVNAIQYNKDQVMKHIHNMGAMDETKQPLEEQRKKIAVMTFLEETASFKKFVKSTRKSSPKKEL